MINNYTVVLAAAITATIACAGTYLLWGPASSRKSRKRRRKAQVPGLLNLGKSCFLNSVLQAMAACPAILQWLAVIDDDDIISHKAKLKAVLPGASVNPLATGNTGGSLKLYSAVFHVLKVLNGMGRGSSPVDTTDASDVLRALRCHGWVISDDEQDAHEMFHVLTSTLEEELRCEEHVPSLVDSVALDSDVQCGSIGGQSRCCDRLPPVNSIRVRFGLPFRGLLTSQLRCKVCHNKSPIKFDTFDSLSLSMPSSPWTRLTLQDCLRHFMMPEQVQDVECEKCSLQQKVTINGEIHPCKTKSTFIKQLNIGKLPDVLCIHIQRMAWLSNGIPMKHYEHVSFPEFLHMDEFLYPHLRATGKLCNLNGGLTSAEVKPTVLTSLIGKSKTQDHSGSSYSGNNKNATISVQLEPSIPQSGWTKPLRSITEIAVQSTMGASVYRLQTVVIHLGDIYSGHFVTYRRGILGGTSRNSWYFCSDTTIHQVPFSEVLGCDAYMLMYERLKTTDISDYT